MSLKASKANNKSLSYQNYSHISEEQKFDLIQEAQNVKYFLEEFEQELNNPETQFFYVISSKWLTEWKQYTSYNNIIEGGEPDYENFGLYRPTKINIDIVLENYYITKYPDKNDYRNVVLKEGAQEKKDYELITETTWKYLAKKYDHVTIQRPVHRFPDGQKFVEVVLKQIQIVPLNNQYFRMMDRFQAHEFKVYRIQASAYTTIQDFKNDLVQIADSEQNNHLFLALSSVFYTPIQVSDEFLRLWLLDPALDQKSYFREVQMICNQSWTYNYQIPFKGKFMEKNTSLTLEEAQITDENVIFLDSRSRNSNWAFIGAEAPVLKKCEYCPSYQEHQIFCTCNQVSYCSEKCRALDLKFHGPLCPANMNNIGE